LHAACGLHERKEIPVKIRLISTCGAWPILAVALAAGCTPAVVAVSPVSAEYRNKSVAVMDVSVAPRKVRFNGLSATWDSTEGERMSRALERELIDLAVYKLQDRSRLSKVVDEMDLQSTSLVDTDTAVRAGKLAGLEGVVLVQSRGEFSLYFGIFMDMEKVAIARLIDVETGSIVWSAEGRLRDMSLVLPPWSAIGEAPEERIARALSRELCHKLQLWRR